MELEGRTAIVTGSGQGIGRALALEFGRCGANVVCCARRLHQIAETVALIEKEGGRGLAIAADVTKSDEVESMVRRTLERFGCINLLFNNAGSFQAIGAPWEIDPVLWWHDVTVNLLGPMLCSRAVLPHMMGRNQGIIINMDGGKALPGGSGYACSKQALLRLTDCFARALQQVGSSVLVMALGPGFVRTQMTALQASTSQGRQWIPSTKEALDQNQDRPAEDCAKATVRLLRVACPELNGHTFGIDDNFEELAARARTYPRDQ